MKGASAKTKIEKRTTFNTFTKKEMMMAEMMMDKPKINKKFNVLFFMFRNKV